MRVLVNVLTAAGSRTGIGHYTAQLLRCLREQAGDDAVETFPGPWLRGARALAARLRGRLGRTPTSPAAETMPSWRAGLLGRLRTVGDYLVARRFHAAARRGRFDVYHEPNFLPQASDLPTVATFHDLSVLLHPEWHPADRVAHFERRLSRGLTRCTHVLTISDFARREVLRTFGLNRGQVTRTYMGVRPGLGPLPEATVGMELRRRNLPPRYLLFVGTIEPRKNIRMLLRAYCSLPGSVRARYPLLLAGGWGWNVAAEADYLDREARHRGVRRLGYVSEDDLAVLYNGARALAYPSLYEGFGLPPVEMLACGGAVLASTAPALAETLGGQAHLIEPLDVAGWRQALLRVCTDDDWWRCLRLGAVEAARPYTWERCAADTLRVYRALAGQTAAAPAQPRNHERSRACA
jgi:alpha-1,3-rhamnosyl/mannosyltransferase